MGERENIEIVKKLFEAVDRRDMEALMQLYSPDVVMRAGGRAAIPYAGVFEGHAGIQSYFRALSQTVRMQEFQIRDTIAQGEKVVAEGRVRGAVQATGRVFEMDWVMRFTVKDGRITEVANYYDTDAVVRALWPPK